MRIRVLNRSEHTHDVCLAAVCQNEDAIRHLNDSERSHMFLSEYERLLMLSLPSFRS